jgi:hypothetical protein
MFIMPCRQTLAIMLLHTSWSLVHVISFVVDFLPCHFTRSSSIFSRCLSLSFLPFILAVVTIFYSFPFLKMCLMNLDCFFLSSTIILIFFDLFWNDLIRYLICPWHLQHSSPKPHLCCLHLFLNFLILCPSFTTIIKYCTCFLMSIYIIFLIAYNFSLLLKCYFYLAYSAYHYCGTYVI